MDPDLTLFAKVVEAGSMSAAARGNGLSAAMVSKRIARLEARLGARLLIRTTRRLETTPRGQRFYEDVVRLLGELSVAEARVADRGASPAGPVRVTAPTSFARMHLAPRLKPFLDRYPEVALTLDLSDGFRDIGREGFDIAIRITAGTTPGLVSHRLAGNRRILCAAPDYLALHGAIVDPAGLAIHRLLAADGQMPWRLTGPAGPVTVEGTPHVRTNSSEVVRELTLAGVGIALRSLWDVGAELASGHLVRVLPDVEGSEDAAVFAVHGRAGLSSGAAALLDFIRTLWEPSPPWDTHPKV
ncbi:MAG: LysR family transcriptional regulator [Sphingobium sp.]